MGNRIFILLLIIPLNLFSQEERKFIRDGVHSYEKGDYQEAEVEFLKAEEVSKDPYIPQFNKAAVLYKQENLEAAGKQMEELLQSSGNEEHRADLLHNYGNTLLKAEKYGEAAEAYKESLRINPADEETRYNLAYALEKLREQQNQDQQQQDSEDQQQNQDQQQQDSEDQQQNQDQQQQDSEDQQQNQDQQQQDSEDQQQNQDQQQEQNQDQQQQDSEEQEQNSDSQQDQAKKPVQLSKEEAERLLNALLENEKEVKEKVDRQKVKSKVKSDKDW